MNIDLKKLVQDLDKVLDERGSSFDAPAREALKFRIDNLKRKVDDASAAEKLKLRAEALNVLAALVSVVTNVMTLLK